MTRGDWSKATAELYLALPLCGHMRAGVFQAAQLGMQSCKGLSD